MSVAGTGPDAEGCGPGTHRKHSARDLLHDRVRRGVQLRQRRVEMAGRELSARRGAVLALAGRAAHDGGLHPARDRICGLPHAAPARARDARDLAGRLADDAADRLQHDAARRRDRDHVFVADLLDARLGLFPARESRPDALGRSAGRIPRRADHRQSRHRHVPDRRAVRARQRDPVRHRGGGRARHGGNRVRPKR